MADPQSPNPTSNDAPSNASSLPNLRSLQDIIDVLPAGVLILDAESRILAKNRITDQVAGISLSEDGGPIDAAGIYDLQRIRHLDGSPYRAGELATHRALLGEVVLCERFMLSATTEGPARVLLANTVPLHDPAGNIEGTVAVFQDITPILDAEHIRRALLADAGHDLQNLLTGILGLSQILKLQIVGDAVQDRSAVVDALDSIGRLARRLSDHVHSYIDIANNPPDHVISLQRSPVNLIALARRVAEEYRLQTTLHEIHVVTPEADMSGLFDENRLHSAVANLVGNAIKYYPQGGDITISLTKMVKEAAPWVRLAVSDAGMGIPAIELSHVFERHYRASNVASVIPGTGLGLHAVQRIVTMHGGTVDIQSVEGQGTTTTIQLPVAQITAT